MKNKKLSKVTLEDAKLILRDSYLCFKAKTKWVMVDESIVLKEPCVTIQSRNNIFSFTFFNDQIMVSCQDMERNIHEDCFDAKLKCYLKAYQLGYEVPEISKFLKNKTAKRK